MARPYTPRDWMIARLLRRLDLELSRTPWDSCQRPDLDRLILWFDPTHPRPAAHPSTPPLEVRP